MKRLLIISLLVIATIAHANALIALDDTCAGSGDTVTDAMQDRDKNCADIRCALVFQDTAIINVSDGASDADDGTRLEGSASFLTENENDLRSLSGTCEMPEFREAFCSARGDWTLVVGIARHYKDATGTHGDEGADNWNDAIFGDGPTLEGFNTEYGTVVIPDDVYTCEDTLAPQLLIREKIDLRSGTRNFTIEFSDNEWAYRERYGSESVELLLNLSFDSSMSLPDIDTTELQEDSCAYAIVEGDAEPTSWTEVACSGHDQRFDFGTDPGMYLQDSVLWLRANDTASPRNNATRRYELRDLFEANGGQGYCPRANECLVNPTSTDLGNNTFEAYRLNEAAPAPACVEVGLGADDHYCSAAGYRLRSQALLEFGAATLADTSGLVYCGEPNEIYDQEGVTNDPCTNSDKDDRCTLTCTVSEDAQANENGYAFQRASTVFATNNFLKAGEERGYVQIPAGAAKYTLSDLDRTTGEPARTIEYVDVTDCLNDGAADCTVSTHTRQEWGSQNVVLRYENKSGIASIDQPDGLGTPIFTDGRIDDGYALLRDAGLDALTGAIAAYVNDIALDGSDVPYQALSAQRLENTARASAYRQTSGGTILALTTEHESFEFRSTGITDDSRSAGLHVVGVVYTGSFDLTYLDNAKDALSEYTFTDTPVRWSGPDAVSSTMDDSRLIIIVTANDRAGAHELIEMLVARLRPEGS